MSDFTRQWLQKRFPEQYGEKGQARAKKVIDKVIKDQGLPPLSDKEAWKATEAKAMDYYFAKAEKEFDTSILEYFELDVRSFYEMLGKADHQSKAGAGITEMTRMYMDSAVDAFINAEAQGLDFTESLKLTAKEITENCGGRAPHDTTIRGWLKEIAGTAYSTIPASPGKGRPKTVN